MHGAPNTPHEQGQSTGQQRGQSPPRTRSWIVTAFNRLVLGRRYESLSVGEVSRRAGVGRSTFYEHFDDKDDLLRQAVQPILAPLADAAVGRSSLERVQFVLDHIAENRPRTLAMLNSDTRFQIERALADLIAERLTQHAPHTALGAHTLAAAQIAGAHIALLTAWLKEHPPTCPSSRIAAMIMEQVPRAVRTASPATSASPDSPGAGGTRRSRSDPTPRG